MEVSLPLLLLDYPGFLQEVVLNVSARWVTLEVKVDVHVFTESAGIVVSVRLGVAEGFHQLVGSDQHVGYPKDGSCDQHVIKNNVLNVNSKLEL